MNRVPSAPSLLAWAAALAAGMPATPAGARGQEATWNDSRTLDLVARSRAERSSTAVDSAFRSYRAQARGYVYFFIDRPDSDERTLVKADQIALEISWGAPNRTAQRIVGLRDEKLLPTNIRYHLDHLTVVQDDFGNRIRLGDGDEVSEVLHPMAPGGPAVYDYQLADSLSIRYGGGEDEVRVYEIRVRPKDPDRPGFIGTVYVDRARAAIVRMRFTFTPASYVDPYLDYIRISLDNSLWETHHWLPYRQEVELRRELPQLDFLAGSVIRGRFEIDRYEINVDLPSASFPPGRVTAVSESERRAYPFEQGLFDELAEEGLSTPPSLEDVKEQARRMLAERALTGLAPVRFHVPSVSDVVRYDRAEGLFLGAGLNLRPAGEGLVRISGGYAVSRRKPAFALAATVEAGAAVTDFEAYWDDLRDIGPLAATAPLLGSFAGMMFDEDHLDPFFARGVRLGLRGPRLGVGPRLGLTLESHRSASLEVTGDFRPVLPVDEGMLAALDVTLPASLPADGRAFITGEVGGLAGRAFASLRAAASWQLAAEGAGWKGAVQADAAITTPDTPAQMRYLLGGAGTLPGHPLRGYQGRAFWLLRLEGSRPLLHPWVSVRAFAAVGASHLADVERLPAGWALDDTDTALASVGAGLAFGWDVLRLDLARGLGGGRWEVVFSVEPRFHPFL